MAAPLGQRVPSLCGLRGSPSMLTILPSTVWISVAHPTEQNGQMLGVVLASLIRNSCARAAAGASVTPSPTSPPIAVPAPALAVSCRKSRRLTCMESSPLEEWGWAGPIADDIRTGFWARNPLPMSQSLACARSGVGRAGALVSLNARATGAHSRAFRDPGDARAAQNRAGRVRATHTPADHAP